MADATQSQVYQTNIPQQLLPYEQNLLDTASQFTNIANNPYQAYTGERVAQFSPLQQNAMNAAGQLGVAGQIGAGTDLAAGAGLGAMGAGQNYAMQATNPGAVGAYMNPYLMQSLAPQMQLLQQQQGIQGTQLASQASQAGAFGGSRYGLQQGLQNQSNQLAMSNLVGQGFNTAYNNAISNMQFGANLGLQGYQTGLSAANTLGNLGQLQNTQQTNNINTMANLGAVQQNNAQQILNNQYQDYLNYQNYPYQQMGFMSDLIRGAPLSQTGSAIYQGAPTTLQNMVGLGLGAYGINQLTKSSAEGGTVSSYADGGSVESPSNIESIVGQLSDQQLQQAAQAAQARGDQEELQAIQNEMAMRASERNGLAGAFNQLPQQSQTRMLAGGGMVAFAGDEDENDEDTGQLVSSTPANDGSVGNAGLQNQFGNALLSKIKEMEQAKGYKPLTEAEHQAAVTNTMSQFRTAMGPDIYAPMQAQLQEQETDRGKALEQAKGLSALKAMGAVLQPGGTMRGLAAGAGAFADSYNTALAADRAEKRNIAQMKFSLADAQRKENMGLFKEARSDVQNSEVAKLNAIKADQTKNAAIANALGKGLAATRPAAAKNPPQPKESVAQIGAIAAQMKVDHPDWTPTQVQAEAVKDYLARTKTGTSGAVAKTYGDAAKDFKSFATLNKSKVDQIVKDRFGGDFDAYKEDYIGRVMQGLPTDIYSAKAAPKATPKGGAAAGKTAEKDDPLGIR
jgi:hypothetical protein